jgi:hypothetical protein
MLSRRNLLIAFPGACLGLSQRAIAADRWAGRRPEEWTPSDIQDVVDRSAWTREVTLSSVPATPGQPKGQSQPRASLSEFKVFVRWESGLPMRLARHTATLPDKGADRYMISVSRMPVEYMTAAMGLKTADAAEAAIADQFASSCSINRDSRESIRAERAYWVYDNFSRRVNIVFPRAKNPIRLEDWEVTVSGRAGEFLLRARFSLNQMVYRGELEL